MDLLTAIRLFVDVTQSGSFSATADRFELTASAVNRRVQNLESHLGTKLIQRTTRRHQLTEVGAHYLSQIRPIIQDLDAVTEGVQTWSEETRGLLRLTAPTVFGRLHIAPMIGRFLAEHPGVELELLLTDELVDLVGAGIDLAIRISPPTDSSLRARRLVPMDRVLVASPKYLARAGSPHHPGELTGHQCLTFGSRAFAGASERWSTPAKHWTFRPRQGAEGPIEVVVSGRIRSNSADALLQAVTDGAGIALVPAWAVLDALDQRELTRVLPGFSVGPQNVDNAAQLLYPSRDYLPQKVRAFIDFAADHFVAIAERIHALTVPTIPSTVDTPNHPG
ncbi:MAG: LysR family transcriptional regulator [Pseudomonadota bacterium]